MPNYTQLLHGKNLYVTLAEKCERLTSSDSLVVLCDLVPELQSHQEEADTCLHHAATSGNAAVIIKLPDANVAVIRAWAASRILVLPIGANSSAYLTCQGFTGAKYAKHCWVFTHLQAVVRSVCFQREAKTVRLN